LSIATQPLVQQLDDAHPGTALLAAKLMQFNEKHARPYDFVALRLGILDSAGQVVAGLLGATGWQWLNIDILYVNENQRGIGCGSALVHAAVAAARARGCYGAMLDTFDFQARGFYQKLGFEVFATLDNMPPGHQRFWMKRLL
jgi:GNAT superfamily N-acetyltransferase